MHGLTMQKFEYSAGILECMQELKAAGANPKWGAAAETLARRSVFQVRGGPLCACKVSSNPPRGALPLARRSVFQVRGGEEGGPAG